MPFICHVYRNVIDLTIYSIGCDLVTGILLQGCSIIDKYSALMQQQAKLYTQFPLVK